MGQQPLLTEIPCPVPGPGEILVRITACGLNFADLLMIKGQYQETPEAPFTLGLEVAGIVEALGLIRMGRPSRPEWPFSAAAGAWLSTASSPQNARWLCPIR